MQRGAEGIIARTYSRVAPQVSSGKKLPSTLQRKTGTHR